VTLAIPTIPRLKFWSLRAIARVGLALQSFAIGLMFFAGLASITYGCWMVYKPLGPMMGGVLAVSMALWLARK
jgi:hypothetical protein